MFGNERTFGTLSLFVQKYGWKTLILVISVSWEATLFQVLSDAYDFIFLAFLSPPWPCRATNILVASQGHRGDKNNKKLKYIP